MGREFDNEYLKRYLRKLKIKLYISVSENKCSMVEIAQKNLQRRLYSYMVQNETLEYLPILQHSCTAYNNSFHRSIKTTPTKAKKPENLERIVLDNLKKLQMSKSLKNQPKFIVGDIVRVSLDKKKNMFSRSYNLQNSYAKYEIYKISTKNTVHAKYYLKHIESTQKITNGYFYAWQLTKCTNPSFRGTVVKTRKQRGRKEYLFHFKGYPKEFDQWRRKNDLSKLV